MPTLRQYLEQKYGTPAGYAPLPIQQDKTKQKDALPLASSSIFTRQKLDLSSQPAAPFADTESSDPVSGAESDTEVEDNTEIEEYYLAKPCRIDADVGSIFGKGIRVWRSHHGTAYTHISGELVNGEVVMPRKRKRGQRSTAASLQEYDGMCNDRGVASKNKYLSRKTTDVLPPAQNMINQHARPRRLISGSFGTFEEKPNRFSARPYRLLQKQPQNRCEEAREEKEIKLSDEVEGEDVRGRKRRWLHKLGDGG